jgi:hypothetical protein
VGRVGWGFKSACAEISVLVAVSEVAAGTAKVTRPLREF